MRVTFTLDSTTPEQMRRAVLAYHLTDDLYPAPLLVLDGLVVKVEGPYGYRVESPPLPAERVRSVLAGALDEANITELYEARQARRNVGT